MAQQVVGEALEPTFFGHLAGEGVGGRGRTQGVLVAQVPTLQLVGGKEEAERGLGQLVGELCRELEG